jgi:Type ISP C-terminal specificity domain
MGCFKLTANPLRNEAARYDPDKTRKRLMHSEGFRLEQIVRYFIRPFEFQFCYYSGVRPLWNEPRPQLWNLTKIRGNRFLISRPAGVSSPEGVPFYFSDKLGDNDAIRGHAYYFPVRYYKDEGTLLGKTEAVNLSDSTRHYLNALGYSDFDDNVDVYAGPWCHALAIGFSPAYLDEHHEGIMLAWPRIPMPLQRADYDRSVELGRQLAALLDPDTGVASVTSGAVSEQYRIMGVLSATDLRVQAGWGHKDKQGHVNPGKGRSVLRTYTAAETKAIEAGAMTVGIDAARALELLGPPIDVYLNEITCWRCVPKSIWDYVIGGYQVLKKWLSYREQDVLDRPLTKEEGREFTSIVRRLAAIVLMTDSLNANYVAASDNSFVWPSESANAGGPALAE